MGSEIYPSTFRGRNEGLLSTMLEAIRLNNLHLFKLIYLRMISIWDRQSVRDFNNNRHQRNRLIRKIINTIISLPIERISRWFPAIVELTDRIWMKSKLVQDIWDNFIERKYIRGIMMILTNIKKYRIKTTDTVITCLENIEDPFYSTLLDKIINKFNAMVPDHDGDDDIELGLETLIVELPTLTPKIIDSIMSINMSVDWWTPKKDMFNSSIKDNNIDAMEHIISKYGMIEVDDFDYNSLYAEGMDAFIMLIDKYNFEPCWDTFISTIIEFEFNIHCQICGDEKLCRESCKPNKFIILYEVIQRYPEKVKEYFIRDADYDSPYALESMSRDFKDIITVSVHAEEILNFIVKSINDKDYFESLQIDSELFKTILRQHFY